MKRILLAIFAGIAIALVGCDQNKDTTQDTKGAAVTNAAVTNKP